MTVIAGGSVDLCRKQLPLAIQLFRSVVLNHDYVMHEASGAAMSNNMYFGRTLGGDSLILQRWPALERVILLVTPKKYIGTLVDASTDDEETEASRKKDIESFKAQWRMGARKTAIAGGKPWGKVPIFSYAALK